MINDLKQQNIIVSERVEQVFTQLDRQFFTPNQATIDRAQSIGMGATIEAAGLQAQVLELLQGHLEGASKCLDLGYGSGFMSTAMRLLMYKVPNAVVFAIDHVRDFIDTAEANVVNAGHEQLLTDYKLVFMAADARKGLKRQKPFQCIYVGAAFQAYPKQLEDQLSLGGRMILTLRGEPFKLIVVDRDLSGTVTRQDIATTFESHKQAESMTDLHEQCSECALSELEHRKRIEESFSPDSEPLEGYDDL